MTAAAIKLRKTLRMMRKIKPGIQNWRSQKRVASDLNVQAEIADAVPTP